MKRPAAVSGSFYPGTAAACRDALEACLAAPPLPPLPAGPVLGGIVPHAGWVYSGATAGLTFRAVRKGPPPRCFVLFGAVHQQGVTAPVLSPDRAWSTPLGDVPVDRDIAEALSAAVGAEMDRDATAHRREHSLEVQVPFVAHLYPDCAILPVLVPPIPSAVDFGEAAGRVFAAVEGRVVVLGSTDLTHYGARFYGFDPMGTGRDAHRWSKEVNDREFLDRVIELDPKGVLDTATARRNACGGGAAAAAVAAAVAMGADSASLLAHTTSHEVRPDLGEPVDFVGYASLVFAASGD